LILLAPAKWNEAGIATANPAFAGEAISDTGYRIKSKIISKSKKLQTPCFQTPDYNFCIRYSLPARLETIAINRIKNNINRFIFLPIII